MSTIARQPSRVRGTGWGSYTEQAFALDRHAVEEGAYTLAGLRKFWAPADCHHTDARKVLVPPK
jgi:hypothetical protein